MVKLNLSAMQKVASDTPNNSEITDNIKQDTTESSIKSDNIKPILNTSIPKKKVSLNALISWTSISENTRKEIDKKENIINTENTPKNTKISLKQDLGISIPSLSVSEIKEEIADASINIENNSASVELEIKEEEKNTDLDLLENNKIDIPKIEEEKKEIKEKSIDISDWDTIWNLLTDFNKNEMFTSYVSSFEKDMQNLKTKKNGLLDIFKKKKDKDSEKVVKEEKISSEQINKENTDLDLDKIIEESKKTLTDSSITENNSTPIEIELKEEKNIEIKTDKKEKTGKKTKEKLSIIEEKQDIDNKNTENLDSKNAINTRYKNILRIWLPIFTLFTIMVLGFFYYLNFDKSIKKDWINAGTIETTKISDKPIVNTQTWKTELNSTWNNTKVKQELIKYFKNKQNNVKIQ